MTPARASVYLDALARVIYDAAPVQDTRYIHGQTEWYSVSWEDVHEAERERSRKQAQAIINLVRQGTKP